MNDKKIKLDPEAILLIWAGVFVTCLPVLVWFVKGLVTP